MPATVTICSSCLMGQGDFAETLARHLPGWTVSRRECMSGCQRPSTLAFRAEGKTAYLFGALTPDDLPLILRFAAAYDASPDGDFADARIFGDLRRKVIARIPG